MLTANRGQIYVGYQLAATIEQVELRPVPITAIGTPAVHSGLAVIRTLDRFWITQRPMSISIWMGSRWWTWERTEVSVPIIPTVGAQIDIKVMGAPEVTKFI